MYFARTRAVSVAGAVGEGEVPSRQILPLRVRQDQGRFPLSVCPCAYVYPCVQCVTATRDPRSILRRRRRQLFVRDEEAAFCKGEGDSGEGDSLL